MAIFASTTTSGYSDPLKALSIKALEQRQKDLLAQQAREGMPESIPSPLQGAGYAINQFAEGMQQNRVNSAIAAQKEELANLVARSAAGGLDPQGLGRMSAIAPEMAQHYLDQQAAARTAAKLAETQAISQGHQFDFQGWKDEQDRLARTRDEELRITAAQKAADLLEQRKQAAVVAEHDWQAKQPKGELAIAQSELRKAEGFQPGEGPPSPEVAQLRAKVADLARPPEAVLKGNEELQTTYIGTLSGLHDLKEARSLLGEHGEGVRSGRGSSWRQEAAAGIGDALGMSSPKLTEATERYGQLTTAEAINTMAQKLKGATTVEEMNAFVRMMSDPNILPKNKIAIMDDMIAKAEGNLKVQGQQLTARNLPIPEYKPPAHQQALEAGGAPTPAPTAPAGGSADPFEGRTISNDQGVRMRRHNGKWEPM